MLYGHGDDRHLYKQKIIADFSSNVRYENFPATLKAVLINQIDHVVHYPEPNAETLQKKIAEFHGVATNQVLVTNGSTEAFYLVARRFENTSAIIPVPTFAEYEDACHTYHIQVQAIQWEEVNEKLPVNTRLLFICNPNNPTGSILKAEIIKSILVNNPQTVMVLDEANTDLTAHNTSMIESLSPFQNLIIMRSLTKTFAIPGLRLGYIISNSNLIENITANKMPWTVNTLALKAGEHIIDNFKELIKKSDVRKLLSDTQELRKQINAIDGFEALPTATSYFLVRLKKEGKSKDLKSFLVSEHGILIRDAGNFNGLDSSYIRISTQSKEENDLLVNGLKAWKAT